MDTVYQCKLSVPSLQGQLMSINKSYGVNRHTTWCVSPMSVVSQLWLVSRWGLGQCWPMGPYGSQRTFLYFTSLHYHHICYVIHSQRHQKIHLWNDLIKCRVGNKNLLNSSKMKNLSEISHVTGSSWGGHKHVVLVCAIDFHRDQLEWSTSIRLVFPPLKTCPQTHQ